MPGSNQMGGLRGMWGLNRMRGADRNLDLNLMCLPLCGSLKAFDYLPLGVRIELPSVAIAMVWQLRYRPAQT
jgi:hypothetical protein